MTNGTLLPPPGVCSELASLAPDCEVQISDYGPLSPRVRDLEELFARHGIPCRTKIFHGGLQHYGGWVDNTSYAFRKYTQPQVQDLFRSCWQIRLANAHMYRGRIHPCIRSLFGPDLGLIPVPPGDYVDVRDLSQSREEKREILARFGQLPPLACQYLRRLRLAPRRALPGGGAGRAVIDRRPLGQTGILLSAVGVGTTRFPHQRAAGQRRAGPLRRPAGGSGAQRRERGGTRRSATPKAAAARSAPACCASCRGRTCASP